MPRTTPENVATVIEVDQAVSLDAFIAVANDLTTEICGNAGYSDARLELIERYLAAHFYAIRDPQAISQTIGPASESFALKTDFTLFLTSWGQQAVLLDTKGGLSKLNAQSKPDSSVRTGRVLFVGGCRP